MDRGRVRRSSVSLVVVAALDDLHGVIDNPVHQAVLGLHGRRFRILRPGQAQVRVHLPGQPRLILSSVTRQLYSSVLRTSPTCRNQIVSDTRIGGRQVPFLDPHHVPAPPRLCLESCQPDLRHSQWLATIPSCPTSEPDVRDALREDNVIDGLTFSVIITIGQSVEVVAAFFVSPREKKEMPLISRLGQEFVEVLTGPVFRKDLRAHLRKLVQAQGDRSTLDLRPPCLLRACPFTHQARCWGRRDLNDAATLLAIGVHPRTVRLLVTSASICELNVDPEHLLQGQECDLFFTTCLHAGHIAHDLESIIHGLQALLLLWFIWRHAIL